MKPLPYLPWKITGNVGVEVLPLSGLNKELERSFLARARVKLAGGGTPMERPIGQAARGVEVYNELDDDED